MADELMADEPVTAERRPGEAPRLGVAIRTALSDFYYNSWRFLPANLIWGATVVILWIGWTATPAFVLLTPLLAFPTAAIFRMAVLVERGERVSFWDGLAVWRTTFGPILLLGAAIAGCTAVFLANIALGLSSGGVFGWSIATLAAWGLAVTWLVAWAAWPLLLDPARAGRRARDRVRTAGLLVLARPRRMIALGVVLAVILLVSTVALIALLTISVAITALIATRSVIPAADRLDERMAARLASRTG
jgi:hypothetical protein